MTPVSRGKTPAPSDPPALYCACPIDAAFDAIGRKWSLLLLRNMLQGQHRFNEFLQSIEGINPKILSQRLKELERERLISRAVLTGRPLVVAYQLTDKGYSIFPVLRAMARWSFRWAPEKVMRDRRGADVEACLEAWTKDILRAMDDLVVERGPDVVQLTQRRRLPP